MDARTHDCLEAGLADIRRRMSRKYSLIALCLAVAFSALYVTAKYRHQDVHLDMHLVGFFVFTLACLIGGHAWCALEVLQEEHDASADFLDYHDFRNEVSQIPDATDRKALARNLGLHNSMDGQNPPGKLNNHHPFDPQHTQQRRKGQ